MRVLPGVFDEHCEFVAAESRDGVTAAHAAEQSLRGLHQQRVAGGLPQVVVDQCEVIDIHGQDRDRTLIAMEELDRMLEPVEEQNPVSQMGQRVAQCPVRHAMQQPPVLGDHQELAGQHRDNQPRHYDERGVGIQGATEIGEFEATGDGQRNVRQPQRRRDGQQRRSLGRRLGRIGRRAECSNAHQHQPCRPAQDPAGCPRGICAGQAGTRRRCRRQPSESDPSSSDHRRAPTSALRGRAPGPPV